MTIKPLFANILIKPKTAEKTTSNGILLPDNAQTDKTQEGEVVAVGEGAEKLDGTLAPIKVKVGDYVIYRTWGALDVKLKEEKHILLDQKDILGVVDHES